MRRAPARLALSAAVLLLAATALAPPARAQAAAPGFAELVAPVLPAVVTIRAVAKAPHGQISSDGSGFVIDPKGLIATNRHVIAGAYDISVKLPGIGRVKATAVYISERIDLAILKVDAGQALPAVTLGDSDAVRVGDEVLLLGNALGVGESLSHGVISALNRDIGETMYDHFFQTDAPINHGNSGGPMLDMHGLVIGINTALDSSPGNTGSVGVGFTMPINDAKFAIAQFLRDGKVEAGTIGVRAQHVTEDLAEAVGLDRPRGLLVNEVDPKGPAAGHVQVGDILLAINGRDAADARELARWVAEAPGGQSIELKLLRGGAEQTASVTVQLVDNNPKLGMALLGPSPGTRTTFATPDAPGMRLTEIGPVSRRQFGITGVDKGVVVTDVVANSAADQRGIVAGDVIVAIGGVPVLRPADVRRQLQAADTAHRPFAALLVHGQHGMRWVALQISAKPEMP